MIVLASKSPRRRELLTQLGVNFISKASDIDETACENESAAVLVARLAEEKATTIYRQTTAPAEDVVIGSDTVVCYDDHILGKPSNQQDAMRMLHVLSGNTHDVLTAVAIRYAGGVVAHTVSNKVSFRDISDEEIQAYCKTGEPYDKAGAYAIQGVAAQFISHLQGSYSAVMGLPLYETAQLLIKVGEPLLLKK